MPRHTLLIPLVGPMQSWGSRSRFEDRDTHPEPTKSAVLGLVCAGLGWGREDTAGLDRLRALRFGVRADQPGRPMTDFQTAQKVRTADGGMRDTVLSTRHYLADARFLAGLEGDDLALLQQIEAALRSPVWTLSLGRKSYPLSLPPYLPRTGGWSGSLYENTDLETAFGWTKTPFLRLYPGESQPPAVVRVLIETNDGPDTFADQPLDFAARRFGLRRVVVASWPVVPPPLPGKEASLPCIFPN